jgi:hypothetical protein
LNTVTIKHSEHNNNTNRRNGKTDFGLQLP